MDVLLENISKALQEYAYNGKSESMHFAQDLREKFSARCVLVGQAACDPANCILAASSNQQAAIKADALHLSIQLDQNDTFRAFQSMQCSVMWK